MSEIRSTEQFPEDALHDPFDHDGFVVSVRRGLFESVATAAHPDGEFICRAVRPHRTLAKTGYWLGASLVIGLGLVGMVAALSHAPGWVQGLATVLSIVYLIIGIGIAIAFAPQSAVVLRLDPHDRYDAIPAMVLHRGRRPSLFGQVFDLHGEHGQNMARLRRYGSASSSYSLWSDAKRDLVRFVPQQKSKGGALLASAFGPFGLLGALFVIGQPPDSWMIVRPKERIRLGSLVKQKSDLGDYVLDLTDDLDRWADRRTMSLAALTVVLNRENAR